MVSTRELEKILFAKVFRPFRIQTTTGRVCVIDDEDDFHLGHSYLRVYTPPPDDPNGAERSEKIPLAEIETITVVAEQSVPQS